MMVLYWVGAALAWPDRVATTYELSAAIDDVVVTADGGTVALLSGARAMVLDMNDWSIVEAAPCDSVGGLASDSVQEDRIYAGCADGSLGWFTRTDAGFEYPSRTIDFSSEELLGLASNGSLVFGIATNPLSSSNPQVLAYNADTQAVMTSGYPSVLWGKTLEDVEAAGQYLVASHGDTTLSKVMTGSGQTSQQWGVPAGTETMDILAVSDARMLIAGGPGGVFDFQTGTDTLTLVLDEEEGVQHATALAANPDEAWFAIYDQEQAAVLVHDLEPTTLMPQATQLDRIDVPSGGGAIQEFGVVDGYLIAGTVRGQLHVITSRPWVEVLESSPSSALSGQDVTVTFTSDASGSWAVLIGADSNTSGRTLASGTMDAEETVSAVITVDDSFAEGENWLRVVLEDEAGETGHDASTVSVDNPPSTVRLTAGNIGFGDGRIIIDWSGIDDEDLSHYMLYASTVEFSADDYPEEGPTFSGVDSDKSGRALNLPRKIVADPGENKTITIEPLTNGATYFAAIRAYDAAGQEGPMSNVVSETPRETFGAADLAGDDGGFACSTLAAPTGGVLALFGLAFAGLRRAGAAVAAVALVTAAPPAHASDSEWPQSGDALSDFVGSSFEARYSSIELSDENLTQVFGTKGHNALWLEFGPTFFELVELTGAIGYYSESGSRVDSDGNRSAEDDTMLAIPLTVDATFRLDVLPEQLIVPFVGVGYDYWLWQESWTGGNKVQGGKKGTHTTMGAHLLLDLFQPARASRLQASSGITDTYITVEYRQQLVGEDDGGLTFSGDLISVGLKLDH
jgi:hypothetical protein